ncbi:transglycosylase family protein [Streptomyces sp. NPDC020917]|uniref:LysM peptidoglycan-binding domain-containing protein n=1 Tax=Streptomyces sp. NPDC020917 TaxID=3365102 RepID=UPI00378A972E
MIELSKYREIRSSRRLSSATRNGVRAATALAALGAGALWPLVTQTASAAPPLRQAAAPPARSSQAGPLHAGPAVHSTLQSGTQLSGPPLAGPAQGPALSGPGQTGGAPGMASTGATLTGGTMPGTGTPAAQQLGGQATAQQTTTTPAQAPATAPGEAPGDTTAASPGNPAADGPATAQPGTPQAAAAPAATAPGSVWDDIAQCESSGDWHINSGNGYYGGLQFWQPTWKRFGGGKFARRADLASRVEQITIAQSVLRDQGWTAWPVCSRRIGLHGRVQPQGDGRHTVVPGETLSGIARSHHVAGGWSRLYQLNQAAVGGDPDQLAVGTVLTLP